MSTQLPFRAIGFNAGQRGDIIIGTVAARAHKEKYPDSRLTLGIHNQYQDMLPLFGNHKFYDDYHLWHTYSGWPGGEDNLFLAQQQFDIVYHAMPTRQNEADWWKTEHQAQNVCSIYGLSYPSNLQCSLERWFDVPDNSGYVAFAPFGGFQDWPNKKSFTLEKANQVVAIINNLGYKVIQIGGPDEPKLHNCEKRNLSYFDSVKNILGCKCFITVDSGMNWVMSAYSFPTLGFYSNSYYSKDYIKNIQPINPNAIYVDETLVVNITLAEIESYIKKIIQ